MALLENEKYRQQAELVLGCFYQKCLDKPSSSMARKGLT